MAKINEVDEKTAALLNYGDLTGNAKEVLGYLFVRGPLEDGDISSKVGRSELVQKGMVQRGYGWTWLTEKGVLAAIYANDVRERADQRWYKKQTGQVW